MARWMIKMVTQLTVDSWLLAVRSWYCISGSWVRPSYYRSSQLQCVKVPAAGLIDN